MDVLERITVRIEPPPRRWCGTWLASAQRRRVGDARDFRVRAVDVRSVGVADCPRKEVAVLKEALRSGGGRSIVIARKVNASHRNRGPRMADSAPSTSSESDDLRPLRNTACSGASVPSCGRRARMPRHQFAVLSKRSS